MRNLLAGLRLRAVEGLLVADDSNIGLIGKHCFSKETNVLGTKIMQKRAILSAHTARVDMLWLCCTPTPTVLCSSSLHGIQAFGPNGTACVSLLCGTAFQPERASELMLNRFFPDQKARLLVTPKQHHAANSFDSSLRRAARWAQSSCSRACRWNPSASCPPYVIRRFTSVVIGTIQVSQSELNRLLWGLPAPQLDMSLKLLTRHVPLSHQRQLQTQEIAFRSSRSAAALLILPSFQNA